MKAFLVYKIVMFIIFCLLGVATFGKPIMNATGTLQNVTDTLQLVAGYLQ